MVATLGELTARGRSFVRDKGGFITDNDWRDWFNEAYFDIASRTELFDQEATGVTLAGFTLPLPTSPELLEIRSLELGASDDVEFVAAEVWDSWKESGATLGHSLGRIFNELIELYPTPVTGTAYVLRYKKLPPRLVTSDDLHLLPTALERKLLEYAKGQAKMKQGELDAAANWIALYETCLPPADNGRSRARPGPLTVTRELNVFDRDIRRAHI